MGLEQVKCNIKHKVTFDGEKQDLERRFFIYFQAILEESLPVPVT